MPLLVLAAMLVLVVLDPVPLRSLRNAGFDQFQRWQPRAYEAPPVRIIDIDDESLRRIGQWPWSRARVAELIEALARLEPASIAVDVVFAERDRKAGDAAAEDPDAALARALRGGKVAMGFALTERGRLLPGALPGADIGVRLKASVLARGGDATRFMAPYAGSVANLPELQDEVAGEGAMTFIPDVDGIVRKVPLLLNLQGELVPSLVAEALRLAGSAPGYTVRSADGGDGGVVDVQIGQRRLETDATASLWVHYSAPRAERYIPAWKLLAGQVPAAQIKDHIVLVGTSAQGLMDLRFSPLGGVIPGVEVHAQALEQVLSQQSLSRPGWTPAAELLALLLGGLAVGALALSRSVAQSFAGFVALSAVLCLGAWLGFSQGRILLDPLVPTLALALVFVPSTLTRHLLSERRQRWMKQTFSRYVSPNLVDYLVANPQALELGGRRQRCSFVFTDLAGFTSLMETMDPGTAVSVLNTYLDRMIAIAFEHEGTLDRIVGDAVAIVFSAPLEQADHEQRALRCALQMHAFARGYVDELARKGIPFSATRIGVHTGEVTVGNFGGDAIFDYRALGDPVNTAARLEGANKHFGTLICVSEATLAACPGAITRPIGRVRLAGRSAYLMVHEAIAVDGAPDDLPYRHAFELMQAGDEAALGAFQALEAARPQDPLVRLHAARLRAGARDDAMDLDKK